MIVAGLCVGIVRLWASCMTCWSSHGENSWWVDEVPWLCMHMMVVRASTGWL